MRHLQGISAATLILGAASSPATAGQWRCYRDVAAFTEHRAFTQHTGFECGGILFPFTPWPVYPGHCGDWSHTPGATYVDWIGGVSESCNDHDEGFMGPYDREWHGCSINSGLFQFSALQRSDSLRWIGGVNPYWSAWPSELYEGFYEDYQLAALDGATVYMRDASGQVGDLDTCSHIQELNWVNWGSFPLGVFIASGDPYNPSGLLDLRAGGRGDYSCSPQGDMCRPQYCSDLIVNVFLTCDPVGGFGGYCGDGVCDSGETPDSCWDCQWWMYP
jgi:hypothetical protein